MHGREGRGSDKPHRAHADANCVLGQCRTSCLFWGCCDRILSSPLVCCWGDVGDDRESTLAPRLGVGEELKEGLKLSCKLRLWK